MARPSGSAVGLMSSWISRFLRCVVVLDVESPFVAGQLLLDAFGRPCSKLVEVAARRLDIRSARGLRRRRLALKESSFTPRIGPISSRQRLASVGAERPRCLRRRRRSSRLDQLDRRPRRCGAAVGRGPLPSDRQSPRRGGRRSWGRPRCRRRSRSLFFLVSRIQLSQALFHCRRALGQLDRGVPSGMTSLATCVGRDRREKTKGQVALRGEEAQHQRSAATKAATRWR